MGNLVSKLTRGKLLLIIFVPILIVGIILLIVFTVPKNDDSTDITPPNKNSDFQTAQASEYNFLSNQPIDISFPIVLLNGFQINKTYFLLQDNKENEVETELVKDADNTYSILAPNGGYRPGGTYQLTLIDAKFADQKIPHNKITFSIAKNEIIDFKLKDEIAVSEILVFGRLENEFLIFDEIIDEALFLKHQISQYRVINEGFETKAFFTVNSISYLDGKTICSGEVPSLDEIFSTLEIFEHVDLTDNDFKLLSNDDIANEILRSDFMEETVSVLVNYQNEVNPSEIKRRYSNNSPSIDPLNQLADDIINDVQISITFETKGNSLLITVDISLENFLKIGSPVQAYVNFYLTLDITVLFDSTVNLDLLAEEFSFTQYLDTTIKAKVRVEAKGEFPLNNEQTDLSSLDGIADTFKNFIKANSATKNLDIPLGKGRVPTRVPALDLFFTIRVLNQIELSASVEAEFTSNNISETILYKIGSNFKHATTKVSKIEINKVALVGKLEYKAGVKLEVSIIMAGVLKIGLTTEIGNYEEIGGIFTLELGDIKKNELSTLSLDGGLFYKISGFVELDLTLLKSRVQTDSRLEKSPLIHFGDSKMRSILNTPTVTLLTSDFAQLPDITISVFDIFTYQETNEIISSLDFSKYFISEKGKYTQIVNNQVVLQSGAPLDFTDTIKIQYRVQTNTSEQATKFLKLKNQNIVAELNITKEPIFITSLDVKITQVTDDPNYENIYHLPSSTPYIVRTDVNGLPDYQVSRLIKITPIVFPADASFQTFDFTITKGEEYIEKILDMPYTTLENGTECFIFRVKDGDLNIGKEINFSFRSNGYTNKHESTNITYVNVNPIITTSIPALSATLISSNTENIPSNSYRQLPNIPFGNLTQVSPGTSFTLSLDKSTLFPINASRGLLANESILYPSQYLTLISQSSACLDQSVFQVNDSTPTGTQITLTYSLGEVTENYYLLVLKKSLVSLELTSSQDILLPGETTLLSVSYLRTDDSLEELSYLDYVILRGSSLCHLESTNNYQSVTLSLTELATYQDVIEIIVLSEGRESNIMKITVGKIDVVSIILTMDGSNKINYHETRQLSASILPLNATFRNISYELVEDDHNIAILDRTSGLLTIGVGAKYNDKVIVQANCDGIFSNPLILTIDYTPVQFLYYQFPEINVKPGEVLNLFDYLIYNIDASEPAFEFSLYYGEFASINNNLLVIKNVEVLPAMADLITITCQDLPDYSYSFEIYLEDESSSVELPTNFGFYVENNQTFLKPGELITVNVEYIGTIFNPELSYDLYNSQIKYEVQGPAQIRDISEYQAIENYFITQQGKLLLLVNSDARYGDEIKLLAKYKSTIYERVFYLTSGVDSISLTHNKTEFTIGDTYQFTAKLFPENLLHDTPKFTFVDPSYLGNIELSQDGLITFSLSSLPFHRVKISIYVALDDKMGSLEIYLNNPITDLKLEVKSVNDNPGYTSYNELGINILDQESSISFKTSYSYLNIVNGVYNHPYRLILNSTAQTYFTVNQDNLTLTSKNLALPGGEYATVWVESEGFISNPITFFIPGAIRTLEDFKSIKNNIFGYYAIYQDIDFLNTFIQLPEFYGIIDGHNHILKNIKSEISLKYGVFGLIQHNYGIIRNLVISDFELGFNDQLNETGLTLIGGIICGINYGQILDCKVSTFGYFQIISYSPTLVFGAVAGINYGLVFRSHVSISITFYSNRVSSTVGINGKISETIFGIITECFDSSYLMNHVDVESTIAAVNLGIITKSTFVGRVFH